MRTAAVRALAAQRDVDAVARGLEGTRLEADHALGKIGLGVAAVDLLDAVLLDEARLDEGLRTRAGLFGGLVYEHDAAGEVVVRGEPAGGAEKPRRVAVMAAAVAAAGNRARPGLAAAVVHRQGVHVGTDGDGVAGTAALDHGDDAALDELRVDLDDAALPVIVADQAHGALGLEAELGVCMNVVTDLLELGHEFGDAGQKTVLKKQSHLGFSIF